MVAIAPFRALRYDPVVADPEQVTSPPHDVVTQDEQADYRARDAHNIMHVIQPVGDAPFEGAARLLQAWQEDGALVRDDKPAYYVYEIHHRGGTMRGFFARIRTDDTYTQIRRHEKTLPGKKRTRLDLRTATRCDTESIWMLYRDERGWVDEVLSSNALEEVVRCHDEEGNEHVVWRVDRPEAVTEVTMQFEDRHVVIADGHHRYQTALDHHAATGRDSDGSILVCLVRDNDPGLRIEPTHRMVVGLDLTTDAAIEAARRHWDVEPWDGPLDGHAARAWVDADPRRCIVLAGDEAWRLDLKTGHEVDEGRGRLDSLVVTRVHDRLLAEWGVTGDNVEDHLRFTRDADEAVAAARTGRAPLVVMLSGEDVDAVLDVASEGHVMPQKATYFVPKLRSGLVLGPLDEARPVDMLAGVEGGRGSFTVPK